MAMLNNQRVFIFVYSLVFVDSNTLSMQKALNLFLDLPSSVFHATHSELLLGTSGRRR
jgi:hypothetical protein